MSNIIDELVYLQTIKDQMQTALSNAGSSRTDFSSMFQNCYGGNSYAKFNARIFKKN